MRLDQKVDVALMNDSACTSSPNWCDPRSFLSMNLPVIAEPHHCHYLSSYILQQLCSVPLLPSFKENKYDLRHTVP